MFNSTTYPSLLIINNKIIDTSVVSVLIFTKKIHFSEPASASLLFDFHSNESFSFKREDILKSSREILSPFFTNNEELILFLDFLNKTSYSLEEIYTQSIHTSNYLSKLPFECLLNQSQRNRKNIIKSFLIEHELKESDYFSISCLNNLAGLRNIIELDLHSPKIYFHHYSTYCFASLLQFIPKEQKNFNFINYQIFLTKMFFKKNNILKTVFSTIKLITKLLLKKEPSKDEYQNAISIMFFIILVLNPKFN